MRPQSRDALAGAHDNLETVLAGRRPAGASTLDPAALGADLFAVTDVLASAAGVRRALTDPARSGEDKAVLVERLFGGRVSAPAVEIVQNLARSRWSSSLDLTDAVDELGVSSVLAAAQAGGRLDAVEDELFRFSRTIAGDSTLRDAFAARTDGADRKEALVHRLLDRKAGPETVQLAVRAAVAPRGLRTERVLETFVDAAAARRRQTVATVVSARPLSETQRERLGAALAHLYGHGVRVNLEVDEAVLGGLRISVGGDLIDATVLSRLQDARRRLAG